MHARPSHTPSYRHHKPSGQAVVTLSGRDMYLGRFDSPERRAEHDRLIAEWLANGRHGIPRLGHLEGRVVRQQRPGLQLGRDRLCTGRAISDHVSVALPYVGIGGLITPLETSIARAGPSGAAQGDCRPWRWRAI
jgi:hypothetical protein